MSLDSLPLVDWNQAVSLAGGNPQLAEELFAMFRRDLPSFRETILSAHAEGRIDELRDSVHKLHGATAYCGVPRLRRIAGSLDLELKQGTLTDLDARLRELLAAIDALSTITLPRG